MGDILNYTDYNFDAIVKQLQDRLALKGSWKDKYLSGTGQMLLEFNAYVLNLVMFYVERAAQESYITTAKNRSSVINLVRLLGYSPKRAISSTGFVTFSIPSPHTEDIFILKYTSVSAASGIQFFVSEDTILGKGSLSVEVPVKQGVKKEITISSDGSIGQEYQISNTDVENNGIEVWIDNVQWTETNSFVLGTSTSTWFKVIAGLDDTLTVQFGDNVNSKAPESGSTIIIRYILTDGVNGNVYTAGAVTQLNSLIYDSKSNKITDILVSNSGVISGGDDMEDMEEIRFEAPRVFATGDRAVTRSDYVAILDNYKQVATSNVWGENEENPPNYDMFNRVKLSLVLQGWVSPSLAFKEELSEYLYTKAQMTVKYTFVDPDIIYVIPTIELKTKKGNTLSVVQSSVEDRISGQFVLGSTTKIAVSKRLGDIYEIVEGAPGVSYSLIKLKIYKELDNPSGGFAPGYTYGAIMDCLPITKGTSALYINDELKATDDGDGSFVGVDPSMTISGVINYTTGKIMAEITPSPSPTDVISVIYEQDKHGDVVVSKNQILKLHKIDITSNSYDT